MKNLILAFCTIAFVYQAEASQTRTITLKTDQPQCDIVLTEDSNASAFQPGTPDTETIVLKKQYGNFGNFHGYEYQYKYSVMAHPGEEGGLDIGVGYSPDENEVSFTVLHSYPVFPKVLAQEMEKLPTTRSYLATLSLPLQTRSIRQQIKVDSMIRFERIFGVPFIRDIAISCK